MASISPELPSTIDSRREEIQMTQQKADDAIRELRNAGDSEVADILFARSEELKKRSDKLLNEYPKTALTTPGSSGDKADFTMPSDETEGKPKVYILSSPNFDKENPVQNIIIIAEEMANTAINYLDKLPNLEVSKMQYLTDMCER
ncbi:hypothetical protein C0993_005285 [Termitomyces sp. T159_Od127]|nr:hypothetical protein C0993_005285 [Termitomyces sp. T159_Od127]